MTANVKANSLVKAYSVKAAVGFAAALAALVYYGSSDDDTQVQPDPMISAAQIVADNLKKPCAENAGKISAVLLSDPKLKCDGLKVLAP